MKVKIKITYKKNGLIFEKYCDSNGFKKITLSKFKELINLSNGFNLSLDKLFITDKYLLAKQIELLDYLNDLKSLKPVILTLFID